MLLMSQPPRRRRHRLLYCLRRRLHSPTITAAASPAAAIATAIASALANACIATFTTAITTARTAATANATAFYSTATYSTSSTTQPPASTHRHALWTARFTCLAQCRRSHGHRINNNSLRASIHSDAQSLLRGSLVSRRRLRGLRKQRTMPQPRGLPPLRGRLEHRMLCSRLCNRPVSGSQWVTRRRRRRSLPQPLQLLQKLVVLSVREPYSYWQSTYQYAKDGVATAIRARGRQESLSNFVFFAARRGYSQQQRIKRACGDPCAFDVLLRTESLTTDWANLLEGLSLPPIALPHLNPSSAHHEAYAELTRQDLDAINSADAWVFQTFGYAMR